MLNRHIAIMQAAGELASLLQDMSGLEKRLQRVALWRPSISLARQSAEGRAIISGMRERLDRQLVVTLVGPCGAGKSTLLNALAGADDLSPSGARRPTTRNLVVLSNDADAVKRLFGEPVFPDTGEEPLKKPDFKVKSNPSAEALTHLMLIDTPDTDSTLCDEHRGQVLHAVSVSDVLICVFDAENPKRRDHADLMAPLIQRFHGASLVAVINKCDRLTPQEIQESIGPDFLEFLARAWDTKPSAVLFTSARGRLSRPAWDPKALPRHDQDQFDTLRELIFTTFNQAGFGADRRMANAGQIRDYVFAQTRAEVDRHRDALVSSLQQLVAADRQALLNALTSLRLDEQRQILGVQVRLYQAMAQRWMGPVGWAVALWSRLLVFGGGMAALVRFGNPLRQLWGLARSFRRFRESRSALEALSDQTRVDAALMKYRKTMWTCWPDIAELLIQGGFDPDVRRLFDPDASATARDLETLWTESLDKEIDHYAGRLSNIFLQFLINLPSLGLMGYAAWLTTKRFFTAAYLTSDFFLHALLTIAIVLLLSFFLLQVVVRLAAGRDRIQQQAFRRVEQAVSAQTDTISHKAGGQIRAVLDLAGKK